MYRFLVLILLAALPAWGNELPYLQQLVQQADDMKLAESREWLNLLHFKPYPFWPGSRSLADDPGFFNAQDGKTNAESELVATLKAFFSEQEETDTQQNPQCRFIARYHWLDEKLHFDASKMKRQECRRYNNWRKSLNPYAITLVFPTAYINSPSSMYGHTLLRIDAKDQDEHTRLLAYSIGYLANNGGDDGIAFAWLGLTGGYPGIFQILPYYLKIREYSDLENRDIWEYRLNLNEAEIDRAMMHIWELSPTNFDYYFFDENCAYHLLSILDVARPGLQLTDKFRWWAIPSDTVRAVAEVPGLVVQTVYRPSNATVIMHRIRSMQPELRPLALGLSIGAIQPEAPEIQHLGKLQQAQVLELGQDYLSYLQAGNGETAERFARIRKLQIARSGLDVANVVPEVALPAVRPDQGHGSLRAGIGGGSRDGVAYQKIAIRPAYHDQSDPDGGYVRGAQIQFFNLELRHYAEEAGLRVEQFVPIDINSLSPRNDYFKPLSWKVNFGWFRKRLAQDNEPLLARLNAGTGLAWDLPSLDHPAALGYLFMDATLETANQYQGHYALGGGPAAGLLWEFRPGWKFDAYARVQRFGLGEVHTAGELSVMQRIGLGRQSSMGIELIRKTESEQYWNDINFSFLSYF